MLSLYDFHAFKIEPSKIGSRTKKDLYRFFEIFRTSCQLNLVKEK